MSEPNFDIDKAEQEYDDARGGPPVGTPDDPIDDTPPDDPALDPAKIEVDEGDPDDAPPGFLSYEDYVAQGGDPDMYRGKKAYESEHDRIQENKRLRREIGGLKETVQMTVDAVKEMTDQQRATLRTEIEAELTTARENEDVDGAIDATKKLEALDRTPATATTQQQEHPTITAFRESNPLIDPSSDQYNPEFESTVQGFYMDTYTKLSSGGTKEIGEASMTRILNKAMKEAKELHADLFESPRNQRQTTPGRTPRRGPGSSNPQKPKAQDYVIDNPTNKRQAHAASEVAETVRQKALDQARRTGKSEADAKKFADEHVQRFEEAIHRD